MLAQRDGGRLGEPAQLTYVDEPVEQGERTGHSENRREHSTTVESLTGPGVTTRVKAMSRIAVVALALVTAACVHAPAQLAARPVATSVPAFSFTDDTFAFANAIREHTPRPHPPDLYANYCFVLARGLRQFHKFARFDPTAARVDAQEYTRLVRAVTSREPWDPSLPAAERVVIPGFANLRAFSAAEEGAVKAGLNARFWTLVHWTNWRVTMPLPDGHQAAVLDEVLDRVAAGGLVQLLITNWPKH